MESVSTEEFDRRFQNMRPLNHGVVRTFSATTSEGQEVALHQLPEASHPMFGQISQAVEACIRQGVGIRERFEFWERVIVLTDPLEPEDTFEAWLSRQTSSPDQPTEPKRASEVLLGGDQGPEPEPVTEPPRREEPPEPSNVDGGITKFLSRDVVQQALGGRGRPPSAGTDEPTVHRPSRSDTVTPHLRREPGRPHQPARAPRARAPSGQTLEPGQIPLRTYLDELLRVSAGGTGGGRQRAAEPGPAAGRAAPVWQEDTGGERTIMARRTELDGAVAPTPAQPVWIPWVVGIGVALLLFLFFFVVL